MLENETVLRGFMDDIAVCYTVTKLEKLGEALTDITDNDLFDLLMGNKTPSAIAELYSYEFMEIFEEMREYVLKTTQR